jgi:hypothetical protein
MLLEIKKQFSLDIKIGELKPATFGMLPIDPIE